LQVYLLGNCINLDKTWQMDCKLGKSYLWNFHWNCCSFSYRTIFLATFGCLVYHIHYVVCTCAVQLQYKNFFLSPAAQLCNKMLCKSLLKSLHLLCIVSKANVSDLTRSANPTYSSSLVSSSSTA